jgi:uncharacterized protein (DUF433 family)
MTHERITRDPAVMLGKPVVRGTRITVEHILREIALGATVSELVDQHPRLTEEDVRAALTYAADYLGHETMIAAEQSAALLRR